MNRKTDDITNVVADLVNDSKDIKNFQQVGQDTYKIYSNISAARTYPFTDMDGTLNFTVTFTSDHQKNAFCELNYKRYDNTVSPGTENVSYVMDISKRVATADSNVTIWDVTIHNYQYVNITYIIYYYVLSYDTGVISA